MLYLIKSPTDALFEILREDPVRPGIPNQTRIGTNRDVFVSRDQDRVLAVTCVSYQDQIPDREEQLFEHSDDPLVAIFYTIWSYCPGAGRDLIFQVQDWIREHHPHIQRFVTLSPPTEMARKFHTKNGALVLRSNPETVNYEYVL
jgi:hypothetical protein